MYKGKLYGSDIDFDRFVKEEIRVMPIVDGYGVNEGRRIKLAVENGWYRVRIGNLVSCEGPASPLEIEEVLKDKKKYLGIALGGEIVPWNFENFYRQGFGETLKVNFLDAPAWELVKFAQWEDGRFYYAGVDYKSSRKIINQVKESFETGKNLNEIKGITPEIRYYFLLISLQHQSFRQLQGIEKMKLSQGEREKRLREFQESFAGRLQKTVEQAGGKLVKFSKRGHDRYTVTWKIGDQRVTSIIKDDMKIYSAGFCLSSQDKRHTMSSLVVLARMFQEEDPLYITRE